MLKTGNEAEEEEKRGRGKTQLNFHNVLIGLFEILFDDSLSARTVGSEENF